MVMLLPPLALTTSPAHLEGTLLPRGFFIVIGLSYLLALAVDRLAERQRFPPTAAILLLGLGLSQGLAGLTHITTVKVETLHRISLALLIFYAGLGTDLRRIRGMAGRGLALGTFGVLLTLLIVGLMLRLAGPMLADGLSAPLPLSAAWLAACCLTPTDSGAQEDLLKSLAHGIPGRLRHLLHFEAALSTLTALLCFSFLAGLFHLHSHSDILGLQVNVAASIGAQIGWVVRHVIAGLLAGGLVGWLAPWLIDRLVRSEQQLLLVTISLCFVAYGVGQIFGGGGLLAVFCAGVWLSNGRYRVTRFDQHALQHVMHPFNTAAELTVLLLLGFLVQPAVLIHMLPLGVLLALVLPIARLTAVSLCLPGHAHPWRERWILAGCGLRGAVPLALAVAMAEELPHLKEMTEGLGETLGPELLALVFLVVLLTLLLQTFVMQKMIGKQKTAFEEEISPPDPSF